MLLGLLVVVEEPFDYGQFLMDKRSGKERKSIMSIILNVSNFSMKNRHYLLVFGHFKIIVKG